jgi:hypothetical protein
MMVYNMGEQKANPLLLRSPETNRQGKTNHIGFSLPAKEMGKMCCSQNQMAVFPFDIDGMETS